MSFFFEEYVSLMDILIDYSDWLIEMGYDYNCRIMFMILAQACFYGMDELHKFISYQKSLVI